MHYPHSFHLARLLLAPLYVALNLVALNLLAPAPLAAQTGWSQPTVTTPLPANWYYRMAYDEGRERAVAVSYAASATHLDVSEWDGQGWTHRTTNLTARQGFGLGYDAHRKRLVLMGGRQGSTYLDETWEWDGTTWTQVRGTAPSPRWFPEITYDSKRKRLVLYGGFDSQNGQRDTFEFDGTDWKVIPTTTAPFPKNSYSLTYDEALDKLTLIGGFALGAFPLEVWTLEATGWVQRQGVFMPNLNTNFWTTYDPLAQRIVYFANGWNGPHETWEWDGNAWTQIRTAQPNLDFTVMTFDRARREIVALGDETRTINATWVYRSALPRAEARIFGQGCGTPSARLVAAPGSLPVLGQNFTVDATNLPGSMGWLTAGLSDQQIGGTPLPLDLSPLSMPGCFLYHSLEASWSFPLATGAGSVTVSIPNHPSLRGLRIYFQTTAGSVASNGLQIVCGSR